MAAIPRLRVVESKWRKTRQKYLQWFEPTRSWRFRRVVPEALRSTIGKTEWTETLDARTENDAIRLVLPHIVKTDQIIALAETGNWPPIPDEDIEHVAFAWWVGEPHAKTMSSAEVPRSVERFLIGPRSLGILDTKPLLEWSRAQTVAILDDPARNASFRRNPDAMSRVIRECRRHRAHYGIHFADKVELEDVTASAEVYAVAPLPVPTPLHSPAPPVVYPPMSLGGEEAPDKSDLISRWAKETAPDARWLYQSRLSMKRFAALVELGHDDATRVTTDDVIRFKEKLDEKGLKPPTINRYLSEIKGPFGWAFKNKKIGVDPGKGVVFARKTRVKSKRRGYTDDQARAILMAARDEDKPYRRWLPWVCAFGGMRLDEVAGRDVADIEKIGSYYVVNIPEPEDDDGSVRVKNDGSVRKVPIHPVVIREGFIEDYVDKLPKDGPLFPDLKPDRFGRRAGTATKEMGRWLRRLQKELGTVLVDSVHYVPNHSWRHRFKSEARSVRMAEEVSDALTGHREGKVSRDYGEYYIETVLGPAIESMLSPFDIVEKLASTDSLLATPDRVSSSGRKTEKSGMSHR